ncbi:MAG: alpha/beta hydrolase fold domain-containing protein, partial [Actinomycetota bacterium]
MSNYRSRQILSLACAVIAVCSPLWAQNPPRLGPPTHADVKYGSRERQVLDFWRAPGDRPSPVLVHIHGGGFVGGDKRSLSPIFLREALASGISVASIHYRFVGKGVTFPAPQQDGARAIQFIRSRSKEWNVDPKRIGAFGGSAGAGISLWVGFHDDMADPKNADPVLRESTRLAVIGSLGGQTTYDPIEIKKLIGGRAWEHPSMFLVYGVSTPDEALNPTPARKMLYDEVSAVTHVSKGDPPVFMIYNEPDGELPANARPGQGLPHPAFARLLTPKLDAAGIPSGGDGGGES